MPSPQFPRGSVLLDLWLLGQPKAHSASSTHISQVIQTLKNKTPKLQSWNKFLSNTKMLSLP